MPVESAADLSAFFNADEFASAADYFPPGGGASTPCTVMIGGKGEFNEFAGKPPMQGTMVLVRLGEIAAPAAGGRFVTSGKTYHIVGKPVLEEPERTIWICMTA